MLYFGKFLWCWLLFVYILKNYLKRGISTEMKGKTNC